MRVGGRVSPAAHLAFPLRPRLRLRPQVSLRLRLRTGAGPARDRVTGSPAADSGDGGTARGQGSPAAHLPCRLRLRLRLRTRAGPARDRVAGSPLADSGGYGTARGQGSPRAALLPCLTCHRLRTVAGPVPDRGSVQDPVAVGWAMGRGPGAESGPGVPGRGPAGDPESGPGRGRGWGPVVRGADSGPGASRCPPASGYVGSGLIPRVPGARAPHSPRRATRAGGLSGGPRRRKAPARRLIGART